MDMLRSASVWLKSQRKQHLAETIQYVSSGGTLSVPATRGSSVFRAEDDYGTFVVVHSVDFIIDAEDLTIVPEKGDEIIAENHRYEVLAPNNEPVWRWSGNNNESVRIHTKEAGEING